LKKRQTSAASRSCRLVGKLDLGQAQSGKLTKNFLDRDVEVMPVLGEVVDDSIGQHQHEGVASGPRFKPDMDRTHLRMHGLAFTKHPLDKSEILVAVLDDVF
jgi:hypothetical protein